MLASDGHAALLALAAAQRMNTDARRAVFCAIMGSEDCLEAFEKLLRLPLKVWQFWET
jgi:nucleolar MIF4G domain-containing protein 1